jgi:hypothetical protein
MKDSKVKYQVIDNFLSEEDHDALRYLTITSQAMPWFLNNEISGEKEDEKDYYFTHLFYNNYTINSNNFHLFKPLLTKLECKALIRIKANLYPGTEILKKHTNHRDFDFDHMAAVYYINDNDGHTILNDSIKIESKANRILIFNPQVEHCSTTCTDQKYRITINFNYM